MFADVSAAVAASLGIRYSAAVVRIERGGRCVYEETFGATTGAADAVPIACDTVFDLASLTKLFVSTAALECVARGVLALDEPLVATFPDWRGTAHATITLRMLLAHTAGFQSGADYRRLRDANLETFALTTPLAAVPGARVVYSDLGFIVLGILLERVSQSSLAAIVVGLCARYGIAAVRYRMPARDRRTIPATETDAWRGCVQGFVHDEKAYLMNGVSGHAGLFGPANAVARLTECYLAVLCGRASPLDPVLARAATRLAADDPILRRGLGWALKTSDENSCGARMSSATFGHTGFTGTSVWADPTRDCSVTLLTNAVYFGRLDIRDVRAAVCDAAIEAIG